MMVLQRLRKYFIGSLSVYTLHSKVSRLAYNGADVGRRYRGERPSKGQDGEGLVSGVIVVSSNHCSSGASSIGAMLTVNTASMSSTQGIVP